MALSARFPAAIVGSQFNSVISVSGGSSPYSFAVRSGVLPPGLSLNPVTGTISGQPSAAGSFVFMISVADNDHSAEGLKKFAISVVQPAIKKTRVQIEVTPATVTLASGATHQFSVRVSNATNTGVVWVSSAGMIGPNGLFTAPAVNTSTTVQVIAISKADPNKRATASANVTAQPAAAALAIANFTLPEAVEGNPYSTSLRVSGGVTPYRWKVAAGTLPSGLVLDNAEGAISGISGQTGVFGFTVEASDASGQTVSRKLSLQVSAANTATVDGPAELPRVYVKSSLVDTPAPGATHLVKDSAGLKSALNSAKCGDTIQLQAGATFSGVFTLPAKNCDDNHWIVLRTSAPDSALPAEGTRLTPCYAGVASLPGRPAYNCSSPRNVLAKLEMPVTGSGPIILGNGANHYRLLGLELTRGVPKSTVYNLVINEHGGSSDHIVIDRSWLHGTAQDETTRGVMLTASTHVAVVDSYFTDFHCIAVSGSCGDSQAIGGGVGTGAMGPYKIVNNFLEAAGENVIFGGGPAEKTPEDIEIRRNHFYKPLMWMKGQPAFVGGRDGRPFIVKNHFELKNGIRVLFEGNVLENSWGGFSQTGFAILLTPKNQAGACPICVVHDVTVRYNSISHTGNGFQIGNGASDSGALSMGMWNVSIHDIVMDDISSIAYNGGGHLFQESNGNHLSVLHDVAINHVTAFTKDAKAAMITVGNKKSFPEMYGFLWANNIFSGAAGIITTGGGAENCAYHQGGSAGVLSSCFKQFEFSHNALIAATGKWPPENYIPSTMSEIRFKATPDQALARYQLQSSSPYARAGTDGKDLGADVEALATAIAGVR